MTVLLWIWSFIARALPKKPEETTTILHKCVVMRCFCPSFDDDISIIRSSGIMKPGEMCLVLGCPGSGCSTFLKAIANQRGEYASVSGDVRYAGINAAEMAKVYKGEVVYNPEGQHITARRVYTIILTLNTCRRHTYRDLDCTTDGCLRPLHQDAWSSWAHSRYFAQGVQRTGSKHVAQDAQYLAHCSDPCRQRICARSFRWGAQACEYC